MTKEELMEKLQTTVTGRCSNGCAYFRTDGPCCDEIRKDVEAFIRCSELNEEPSVMEQVLRFEGCGSSEKSTTDDDVEHPNHYCYGTIECMDYIDSCGYGEPYCVGAAIKYLTRYKHKGTPLKDLKKAAWYVNHVIEKIEDGTYKLEVNENG